METTISSALKALKMPGMAESWRVMEETHQLDKLSVREAMPLLLQAEMDNRETNRISKLIKGAGFRLTATIEELDINAARGVPADVITQLGTGEYIKMGGTIIISGAAGTGKTYLANALGDKACRQGYKVSYFTMQRLSDQMRLARLEGKELRFFEKMTRYDLIIIDDFGMKPIEGQFQNDFEQILDDRYGKKAIIIASQLPVSDWYALFKNELIAEACLDRIIHKATRLQLIGESLRKKY